MNTSRHRVHSIAIACLLGFLPTSGVLADDIEIYVGGDSDVAGVRPNILFILDTSGSMDTDVITQEPYDPSITYPGDCDTDSYYAYRSSWFGPRCSGWGTNVERIDPAYYACHSSLDALGSIGYYQDRFGQWRERNPSHRSYWDDDVDHHDRVTECESDYGVHGRNDGDAAIYPADGNDGPYSTDEGDGVRWRDFDVHTMYTGNYVNWMNDDSTTTSQKRIEIMQDVFKDTLDSINNVNVGLMRFDRYADGGMVVHEVANLATARETLKTQIDEMSAAGNTPLSETLYEAGQYFMGRDVDYGRDSYDEHGSRPSVNESRTGNTYDSPMEYQCQKNFIVYLTDGEPTSDSGADDKIEDLPGNARNCSGNCLDEMAGYLYEKDLRGDLSGDQNAIVYTIGFATDQQLLQDAADLGGGKYYTAENTSELSNALTNIIAEVLAVNTTFTAPAVSVNAFNRTVHLNQLFFTIFKPSARPHWDGNLKRFDLGFVDGEDEIQILDKNDDPAVDPNTGFFKDDSVSFWTPDEHAPDGGEAALGGASSQIALPRKVYTYTGTDSLLTADSNLFHEDNTLITKEEMNIVGESDAYRTKLIQWMRGVDVDDDDDDTDTTDARRVMGDPLHSKPVVVTYGGTTDNPDFTVFMTTNDGMLHAIDGDTGQEEFAFIPESQWDAMNTLYINDAGDLAKNYGLDSPVTAWVNDVNRNGIIETPDADGANDHVYIYFGQRRGGQAYYAMDVTNRSEPEMLWKIDNTTTGYSEMGQTWSQPRVTKVNIDGTVRNVLIFGGGYDPTQDTLDNYTEDDQGRAIFIADAETGEKIWSAGPAGSGADLELDDLKNSIPAEVRVIDINSDGLADRIYAGDMGGRIFRFDIINGNETVNLVSGGMIASLGAAEMATPTIEHNRRFYYPPDVSLTVDSAVGNHLTIALGSGYQAHPLKRNTRERFFAIRDHNIYNVPASYDYGITSASLFDATSNVLGEGDDDERAIALGSLQSADGWYIDLVNTATGIMEGEKVLAEATTLQGTIFFTTFTPVSEANSDSCAPSQGLARAYAVNVKTAAPVDNLDGYGGEDDLTRSDRATNLVRGGIPPEVTILFPEANNGDPLGLVGPEKLPVEMSNDPVRTYWIQGDTE